MIIVTGTIEVDPAQAEALKPHALAVMAETAKEAGCIVYRFYQDVGLPGTFRVYEEWESEAHLAAHGQTPHMIPWRAALAELGLKARAIQIVVPAEIRPL